jgi:hypothetical protein
MGHRPSEQQPDLWIPTADLPQSPGHVFYEKLNRLLAEVSFDRYVEDLCQKYYAEGPAGRRSPRASTSACCSSATSKSWTCNGPSPGGAATASPSLCLDPRFNLDEATAVHGNRPERLTWHR